MHAVAVANVDRWARSLQHLSATVNELHDLGVDFYAVNRGLAVKKGDPTATLILQILAACAEWQASIIWERTKDGLVRKIGRGRHRTGCGVEFPCPRDRVRRAWLDLLPEPSRFEQRPGSARPNLNRAAGRVKRN